MLNRNLITPLLVLCVFMLASALPVEAQTADADSVVVDYSAPLPEFSAVDRPDTIRTNLWLTEALMGEIVTSSAEVIPPEPAAVLLVNAGGRDMDDVFGTVATGILSERGHEIYVVAPDSLVQAPVDFVFEYKVVGVELSYPEVGRTLGLWQRWVARDVSVTAAVDLSRADTGRLLYKDIVTRTFSDRVDNDDFDKAFKSFGVTSQVSQANSRAKSARITGTPELMVNGKYRISTRKAGSQAEMLKIAEYLIEQERAAAGS